MPSGLQLMTGISSRSRAVVRIQKIITRLMERRRSEAKPQREGMTTPIRLMTAMTWPVTTLSRPRLCRNST